jgi:hypothetical protein
MSGLPLPVGDLPPGIVSVRIIRGSFENNVPNQDVQLRVGSTSRVIAAATSADGRAQFNGLKVGDIVRVRTRLDGEVLESQSFPIPSDGGVRLILVSGVGAGVANPEPWADASATTGPPASVPPAVVATPSPQPASGPQTPVQTYIVFGLIVVVAIAAVVFWPRSVPRKQGESGRPSALAAVPRPAPVSRADVFEQLVQLEKAYEEGHLATDPYLTRREALIEDLLQFDTASKTDAA